MMTMEEWERWLKQKSSSQAEAWRGVACLLRWIACLEQNGRERPGTFNRYLANASHSALLRRLVEGKQPFEFPPPLKNAYPWYELLDSGSGEVTGVCEYHGTARVSDLPAPQLSVAGGVWTVLEKRSDSEYVVTYRTNGERFLLRRQEGTTERWLLERL